MNNQLTIFNFDTTSLRVITIDGQPWFVAKDVCDALGMSNPTVTVSTLDNDERAKFNLGQRGLNDVNIVNESGLYAIIVQSRKPEAKRFRKWATSEVLPTIRKTGSYSVVPQPAAPVLDPNDARSLRAWLLTYTERVEVLENRVQEVTHELTGRMTIQKFAALGEVYMTGRTRGRLSYQARAYCLKHGLEIGKQDRKVETEHYEGDKKVNVYPLQALIHACDVLGLKVSREVFLNYH